MSNKAWVVVWFSFGLYFAIAAISGNFFSSVLTFYCGFMAGCYSRLDP